MPRFWFISLLLLLFSCSQNIEPKNGSITLYYLGSNQFQNIDIPQKNINLDNSIILYSDSKKQKAEILYSNLNLKNWKVKKYSINQTINSDFSINQLIFLLIDASKRNDILYISNLLQKKSVKGKIVIADGCADEIFFRKIAHPSNNSVLLTEKVGVNDIIISNGFDLLELPIALVKSNSPNRFSEMLSVAMQNPLDYIVSVDDSAYITIQRNVIKVYGKGQMFMVKHPEAITKVDNGLFGGENLQVSVFLPGDSLVIK